MRGPNVLKKLKRELDDVQPAQYGGLSLAILTLTAAIYAAIYYFTQLFPHVNID